MYVSVIKTVAQISLTFSIGAPSSLLEIGTYAKRKINYMSFVEFGPKNTSRICPQNNLIFHQMTF